MKTRFFDELPREAADLRIEVFVDEQGFREEFGDDDKAARHIVIYDGETAAATARVIGDTAGRIAVKKEYRGFGYGRAVVKAAEKAAFDSGFTELRVHAQKRAVGFYEKCGYKPYGDWEPDEGYPHIWMKKALYMDIGINIGCRQDMTVEEMINAMKQNGFYHTFMMSNRADFKDDAEKIQNAGITIDNLHAPFGSYDGCGINDIWTDGEAGDTMLARLSQGVERCAEFGIPALVVHLSSGESCPHVNNAGHARFSALMELADKAGVTIAYENQRKLSNLAFALENYESARFCWDTGHESAFMRSKQMMPLFGEKLAALHIHDNLCEYDGDKHMLPYDGKIDFDRVARQIAGSDFNGALMLEVISRNSHFYDGVTDAEYYRRAAEAAKRLQKAVAEYRYK